MSGASGALVGLVCGVGLLMIAGWMLARRPMRTLDRIGPFVGAGDRRRPSVDLWSSLNWRTSPAEDLDLQVRLERAGRSTTSMHYRLERILWSTGGALGALLLTSAIHSSWAARIALIATSAAGGWLMCDLLLARAVKARGARIDRQVASLADLLALAASAGVSLAVAIERSADAIAGPLGEELGLAMSHVRTGTALASALRALDVRLGRAPVSRLVDTVLVAIERGTPLAEVLRAHSADARAEEARLLMVLAGRKDVAMLVPVVFLVLPSVVLVAVFPGIQALRAVVG